MNHVSAKSAWFIVFASICLLSSCVDSVEPAGPAQYENPDYPSDYLGYALIPVTFADVFYNQGRVYVVDRGGQRILSFSSTDPNLSDPDSLVAKDTLDLGFPPGKIHFQESSGELFLADNVTNDIYRLDQLQGSTPQLVTQCESIITSIHGADQGASLMVCFLGPEWLVRKISAETGATISEYSTGWPINRTAMSPDGENLLLYNSGRQYLIEIDVETMQQVDSIPLPERAGPFIYNTSGDIVVFNQYSIKPKVYLFDGDSREIKMSISSINPYKYVSLIPGTDVVLAPRRSDSRISVLNTANMIFAPSIFCFSYAELAFSTPENDMIIVASDSPGRIHLYENQP